MENAKIEKLKCDILDDFQSLLSAIPDELDLKLMLWNDSSAVIFIQKEITREMSDQILDSWLQLCFSVAIILSRVS